MSYVEMEAERKNSQIKSEQEKHLNIYVKIGHSWSFAWFICYLLKLNF